MEEIKEIKNEIKNEMKDIRKEMTNIKVELSEIRTKSDTKFAETNKKFENINMWLMALLTSYLTGFVGLAALIFWGRHTSQMLLERRIT